MKKKFLPHFIPVLVLFASCSKNNPGSNPTPPGGGGSGSNNLTITSIAPTNPYPDDEFTINGTGFNANASLDTVEFGRLINGNFGAWHDGLSTEWASLCTVISASATQLKIKAVNSFALDYNSFNASASVAQIRTGGKKVVTPVIPFKRLIMLNGIIDPENNNISIGRPADSLVINGKGYNKNGVTISIGGTALTNFKINNTASSAKATLRLSKTFFGNENDETLTQMKTVTITNADGKSLQKEFNFFLSPFMRVFNMHAENSSYSLSGLNGSGGVIKIFISGANLKNDAVLKVGANNGYLNQSNLPVNGFPDTLTIELAPASLLAGNYQVSIWRSNTLYGLCNFNLTR